MQGSNIQDSKGRLVKSTTMLGKYQVGDMDFDYVNKRLYLSTSSAGLPTNNNFIISLNRDLDDLQVLVTHTTDIAIIRGVGVHPWNNHLFYGALDRDSPFLDLYIRRIDLDGNNDQTIVTHNRVSSSGGVVEAIDVSKDDEYVFYQLGYNYASSGLAPELRRCNADGSGDVSLFTVAAPNTPDSQNFTSSNGGLNSLGVDNTNRRVYWVVTCANFASSGRFTIDRCDFDGSNHTTVFTAAQRIDSHSLSFIRLVGWSHKTNRLYFYLYGSDGFNSTFTANDGSGIYSCDKDGGDVRAEAVSKKWSDGSTGNGEPRSDMVSWKLGCGLEYSGLDARA